MDRLQSLFDEQVKKMASLDEVIYRLISQKLAEHHVRLSPKQINKLKDELRKLSDADEFTFDVDFSSSQLAKLESLKDVSNGRIIVGFSDDDVEQAVAKFERGIQSIIPKITDDFSRILLKEWRASANSVVVGNRNDLLRFTQTVEKHWGKALDSLDALVDLCSDLGSQFNEHNEPEARAANDPVFSVLTYLHVRACQVGREIVVLLRHGFADGAMARWRTLHEITVTAIFIAQAETDAAERYIAHVSITDYKEALQYQQHAASLGFRKLSTKQIQKLKAEKDRLCAIYGSNFAEDYGWAAKALSRPTPNFADIEKQVKLEHMRPVYKLANQNVHAGAKGAVYRLGMPTADSSVLVAGSSIFGLQEPGRNTAISISQITTHFLSHEPNLDRLSVVNALREMMNSTVGAFDKSGSRL